MAVYLDDIAGQGCEDDWAGDNDLAPNAEKVGHQHIWIPGDDGYRRGEVCVYCGKWRDAQSR
jgi:hypothetical protein